MEPVNLLALPAAAWKVENLDDAGHHQVVLEHYDQEQLSLRRYLVFLGIDGETAQEIVQESFLRLHEHLLHGGDRAHLRAWLYRVAHNLARNTQAAFRSSRTGPLEDSLVLGDPVSKAASAEEELLGKERLARFRLAMDRLSAAQRDCLVLRAQGLKYREIAEALQLSVSTVGENVQRGLERLKELL
ncbi:MAG TPA: RNA polymerase sigma factor [Bryobacteraceae bacterium]|jgi:RNA polymerase sigma-70 factor (ECF subfamily)